MSDFTLERPLVVFDLETTGLDVREDRIIQVALARLEQHGDRWLTMKFESLVDPGLQVSDEILELTGISQADLDDAPPFGTDDVAGKIDRMIENADLCGYNINEFDWPILKEEYARSMGRTPPGPEDRAFLDVYELEKHFLPMNLSAVHERYTGEPPENPHHALSDVKATFRVLQEQFKQRDVPGRTPGEIYTVLSGDGVDPQKRLKRTDGGLRICFGQYGDEEPLVTEIYERDQGYIEWMVREMDELRPHIEEEIGGGALL